MHLHDADITKIDYRQNRGELRLYFRYDPALAEGPLRTRPVLALYFRGCKILEWENNFVSSDPPDLSVKLLDMYGAGVFVLDSVPAHIRLSADEVEVAIMEDLPPGDLA